MNETFIYLLKVSSGLGIIFLPYYFLLRNDPNLVVKRFFLFLGVVSSWVFPMITFRRPELLVHLTPSVFIDPEGPATLSYGLAGTGTPAGFTVHWIRVLAITYLSGLAFLLLKNLYIILKWNLTWRRTRNAGGIAFTKTDQVFTLFTRIFIPGTLKDHQDLDNILLHEKAHVQQLHFIDLTLMELTLLFTWFNPFSWLISRMIKENHEHLADRQVLSAGVDPARYRAQLLNHTLGVNVFRLGNQFNHSITLKRFKMMKKPRRSPIGIMKIALLIPAILITLGLTTGMTPQQQKTIKGNVVFADTGEAAIGASVIIAGTTMGTVTDTDGSFMLNVEGDPEIVISFVGFTTLRIKASKAGKGPLKLEQQVFAIDPGLPTDVPRNKISGSLSFSVNGDPDESPVFVLDGAVVTEINDLDPGTIEKVEVFKDPDSEMVKKYNAREGVVVITTKKTDPAEGEEEVDVLKTDEGAFYVVEDMPMFPGGKEALKNYIYSRLVYPADAKEKGITGEVYVQFKVTASGALEDIHVVRSTYEGFNQPAMDVFRDMPAWSPGKQRGKSVKVSVVVPVRFGSGKS
jgi:TonB family protein